MNKIKKRYYVLGSLVLITFLFLFFLSTIIKNYVVNNSKELIGRNITLNDLHINYLKVQVKAKDFTLYELNEKDTFVYFNELLINYDPWKMLSNEYAVSQIRLVKPYIFIKQNGDSFNFDDLIPPTDSVVVEADSAELADENVKFSIRNIDLKNGEFHYYDQQIDNLLDFDNLNLELPLIAWNSQSSEMGVQFNIGESGLVKIDAEILQQEQAYHISFATENIQLSSFTNYLKDYVYISELKGLLQSDIQVKGSLERVDELLVLGEVTVDSVSVTDTRGEQLFYADRAYTQFDSLDLGRMYYTFKKIEVDRPVIAASLNKDQSNWEYFLTPYFADTLQTENDSLQLAEPDSPTLFYRVDSMLLRNGTLVFADNTLNRNFTYKISSIDMTMANLYEQNDAIPLSWDMKFNNEGRYTGETKFSILNPLNLYYKGNVTDLDLHSFSPYTEYYLAFPIVSGLFNYDSDIKMTPANLQNNNHLLVKEMEFGKRTKDTSATKLPIKLALYLIKDAQDNVEFELPVAGNPSEPGFKMAPIIWKTFGKFIAKTATQPFGSLAKLVGTQPEELELVPFSYTQDSLLNSQRKVLDQIAEILQKKDDLIFTFRQEVAVDEEISLLAIKNAKSRYLIEKNPESHTRWEDINDDNEDFTTWLNQLAPDTTDLSLAVRCATLVSESELRATFQALYKKRNELLSNYLLTEKLCDPSSVKLQDVDFTNMPQELKKPGFRVQVSVK
jgi:hypothetical protein